MTDLNRRVKRRSIHPHRALGKGILPCRGSCGRTKDMSSDIRIGQRLGIKRFTWVCAECYKKERKESA